MNRAQQQLLEALSNALFQTNYSITTNILEEASSHAVLPLVFDFCSSIFNGSGEEEYKKWRKLNFTYLRKNMQVEYQHSEVGRLMSTNNIPYVILKGTASGRYYPNPTLRTYGDVDFLVYPEDVDRAGLVLEAEGFKGEEDDGKQMHVAFHRGKEVWELHRSINGGDVEGIISTSVEYNSYKVPDNYHHCMILLLHTASHLTSEGIGLRHLCDWAVFTRMVDVVQWKSELEGYGIWKFARILTAISTKYLCLPEQEWVGEVDEKLVDELMEDILESGNFGKKDKTRPQQIKYISNRGERSVDKKNPILQVLNTIKVKAKQEKKTRIKVVAEYVDMVLKGKRRLDNKHVLDEAGRRKKLYSELELFEK